MSLNNINNEAGVFPALERGDGACASLNTAQFPVFPSLSMVNARSADALWSAAQNARATVHALFVVQASLADGVSTVRVAMNAGRSICALLSQMRAKAFAASKAPSGDIPFHAEDFAALRDQIAEVAATSDFNGANMVAKDGVAVTALASVCGDVKITVAAAPLYLGSPAVAVSADATFATAAEAQAMAAVVESSITGVMGAVAKLGAGAMALSTELSFAQHQASTLTMGVGNIVDADAPSVTAQLTALKAKQQLELQALAIANSKSTHVLNLFAS